MNQASIKEWQSFRESTRLSVVLDHSGRAGNGFFLTIFDQHPQVLCCPWMHYTYSYLVHRFGEKGELLCSELKSFWTDEYYFRALYHDLDENTHDFLHRCGFDVAAEVDRSLVRDVFDSILGASESISRRDLILLTFFAYAKGVGRALDTIEYVLLSDAISLREDVLEEFSGLAVDMMVRDFPEAKLFSLVRDPRAVFASNRHQFVNKNGNMYQIRFGQYLKRFSDLLRQRYSFEGCVFLFWLLYGAKTARTMYRIKARYPDRFKTIRNEDLNLNFREAMKDITTWLDVVSLSEWEDEPFEPTSLGLPWRGTGAYNSRYQPNVFGPLLNDPDSVSNKVTGPNEYVTTRWKKRLNQMEKELLEVLFRDELIDQSYEFLQTRQGCVSKARLLGLLVRPFRGEFPAMRWLLDGRHLGAREVLERAAYYVAAIPFYVVSRVQLYWFIVHKLFFFDLVEKHVENKSS